MVAPPPVTLFAPGGAGDDLERRMRYLAGVGGSKVAVVYGSTGADVGGLRREADRDAADVRFVAVEHGATRAVGFSRGARALCGAMATGASFDRVVLVIPPGGNAAGAWSSWLAGRPTVAGSVLVIGHTGDTAHPARVASTWAELLGARLEVLPSRAVASGVDLVARLIAEHLE